MYPMRRVLYGDGALIWRRPNLSIDQHLNYRGNMFVVAFQLLDPSGDVFVRSHQLPQPHEGAHNKQVHLDRTFTVQHRRQHRHAKLGKRIWPRATAPSTFF